MKVNKMRKEWWQAHTQFNPSEENQLLLLIVIVTTLFVDNYLFGQITSKEVDVLVNNAMEKFQVAGAAVAIVKDGKVIHKKGYGFKSTITKQKVDEYTNFRIASNSKAFTTAALAILVDEGKLSWQDNDELSFPAKGTTVYVDANQTFYTFICCFHLLNDHPAI